jgi:hypothetical protein
MTLASWINKGKVGQPKRDPITGSILGGQSKCTSDITTKKYDIRRPSPVQYIPYYNSDNCVPKETVKMKN